MQIKKRPLHKILAMVLVMIIISGIVAIPVSADYYLTDDELYLQFMPKAYTVKQVVMSITKDADNNPVDYVFNNPEDMYVDGNDNVYVADTGNNKIIELNPQMQLVRKYPAEDSGITLKGPKGVYVDKDGDLYIADTGGERILHLDPAGHYVEEFDQPKDETYDANTAFRPSKVYVDDYGIIYIVNDKDSHGIITMSAEGNFLGYIGAPKMPFSLIDTIVRLFASKEQKAKMIQKNPPYYSNLAINGDGTIYATSVGEKKDQVKRLTPAGTNVFPQKFYAEMHTQTDTNAGLPTLQDIAVNKDGMVFTVDSTENMIYVYDQSGKNVVSFGGIGDTQKNFRIISALSIDSKNDILILDEFLHTIQVLQPTEFMQNVFQAVSLYNNGEYDAAIGPWNKVLSMDSSYKLAQIGIAKALLRSGDSQASLNLYKRAVDKAGYSDAFEQLRSDFFKDNFGLVAFLVVAALAVAYVIIRYLRKYANRVAERPALETRVGGVKFFLDTGACIIFHPMDTFYKLKVNRKSLPYWPILLMLAVLVIEKIAFRQIIHFPLSDSAVYIDYFRDLIIFFLPLVSFILVSFAITSISDGKQTFKETAVCTLYSFIPYMLLYLPITAFSNLLCQSEAGLYNGLQTILFLWCLVLLYLNFKILNEYSFGKAVFTLLKVLFAMVCLWVVCFLFYIVFVQLMTFVKDVTMEFTYLLKQR